MRIIPVILTFLLAFFEVKPVRAEFSFTVPKTTITSEEEIEATVTLSLQGQANKIYYLEGAFQGENSQNYFGLTWNDSSWTKYTASSFTTIKSISTDSSGSWTGLVKSKVDIDSSLFTGTGLYTFKIKRFTTSGSNTWSDNFKALTINTTSSLSPSPSPASSSISTFTISGVPSEIDSTQTFTISVNLELSSYPNTKFYLKGAFAKSGSSNYFGYTKVSGNWVKNSSIYSDQYQITTDSNGKWSGNLEVQIDALDSGYTGTDDYIFKVGRYTETGNGPTWNNSGTNIKINAKEVEDQGGIVDLSGLSTKQPESVLGESQKVSDLPEQVYSLENYRRGATFSATPSSSPTVKIKDQNQNLFFPIVGVIFLGIGLGFGGYQIYKNRVKS